MSFTQKKWPAVIGTILIVGLAAGGCTAKSSGAQSSGAQPSNGGVSDTSALTDPASDAGSATDTDSATDTATDTDTATESSTPTPTPTPTRTAPRTTYSPPPGSVSGCALPYAQVTAKTGPAGASHQSVVILFRNTGQIACALTGYPNVAVTSASGAAVKQAAHTPKGYLGGLRSGQPQTVYLNSGESASALLEGETVDVNGRGCPAEPGLSVSLPGSPTPAKLKLTTRICGGVQVHPIVGGTTGSKG